MLIYISNVGCKRTYTNTCFFRKGSLIADYRITSNTPINQQDVEKKVKTNLMKIKSVAVTKDGHSLKGTVDATSQNMKG